jgi:hypothetical protein
VHQEARTPEPRSPDRTRRRQVSKRGSLHRKQTRGIGVSAFGKWRGKNLCLEKSRDAISRTNGNRRSLEGQVASDPRYRGSAFREFRHQEKLPYGFAIREIPKRTWQGGSPRQSGRQVSRREASPQEADRWHREIGVRGFVIRESYAPRTPELRFPEVS